VVNNVAPIKAAATLSLFPVEGAAAYIYYRKEKAKQRGSGEKRRINAVVRFVHIIFKKMFFLLLYPIQPKMRVRQMPSCKSMGKIAVNPITTPTENARNMFKVRVYIGRIHKIKVHIV